MTGLAERFELAGLMLAYALTGLPMLIGLVQSRATVPKFFAWPLVTAPVALMRALLIATTRCPTIQAGACVTWQEP